MMAASALAQKPVELVVVSRLAVPELRSIPRDIRWAGTKTVYVAWSTDGVKELGLDGRLGYAVVPSLRDLLMIDDYRRLAVGGGRLFVASQEKGMLWRDLATGEGNHVLFHPVEQVREVMAMDAQGDRFLLIGTPRKGGKPQFGASAWLGSTKEGGAWQPLLADPDLTYTLANPLPMGAARFFPDGSCVIATGFQDEIVRFDRSGHRVRSWPASALGIDTMKAVAAMTQDDADRMARSLPVLAAFLASHRIIDDVLPLPEGPGILVRSVGAGGSVHWALKVLRSDGVATYGVPIVGKGPYERMHGDVRDGRIVLLRSNSGFPLRDAPQEMRGGEIVVLGLPKGEGR